VLVAACGLQCACHLLTSCCVAAPLGHSSEAMWEGNARRATLCNLHQHVLTASTEATSHKQQVRTGSTVDLPLFGNTTLHAAGSRSPNAAQLTPNKVAVLHSCPAVSTYQAVHLCAGLQPSCRCNAVHRRRLVMYASGLLTNCEGRTDGQQCASLSCRQSCAGAATVGFCCCLRTVQGALAVMQVKSGICKATVCCPASKN
jgi:hypothetical protein